jgi:CheY-like chemotaxis protein
MSQERGIVAAVSLVCVASVSPFPKDLILLVVEDDEDVRELAVALFESFGLTVHQAADGREALRCLKRHPEIKMMFTDIKMPVMNGNDLVEAALKFRPRLKIVMTTGYSSRITPRHAAIPVVPKPYTIGGLARTFAQVLSKG